MIGEAYNVSFRNMVIKNPINFIHIGLKNLCYLIRSSCPFSTGGAKVMQGDEEFLGKWKAELSQFSSSLGSFWMLQTK
ncbi:MAG TPA: hypothetical protein VIH48_00475 [Candidatus Bathyarchaeia archaeon]